MIYLDTSVYLRILLQNKHALALRSELSMVTSELFIIETNRTLDRVRLEGKISDLKLAELKKNALEFANSLEIFELSEKVRNRAATAFPTILSTLDALHLSTALFIREEKSPQLSLCTQDDQMARCAEALGFDIFKGQP